jgi:hypothetical protein
MTKLAISPDLSLPTDAVTEAIGFLGRRGSGKSYAAQKLAEEFHRARAQFVVLDPVGNWWALRLAADGKGAGIPIPVFGGLQGDVPLEPTAGKLVADTIVDRGISAVIDVSQFESDADKSRFARAFCERFYFRKKSAPSAVHVFLEEAQEFIPQNPGRDDAQMLHAFTRLAKLGRNFGIGISMLSQRPQEVNKKVLNLAELLFVFQLTGVHERKAVEAWIGDKGIDGEDIEAELPKLERGHPHAWSPAWLKVSEIVAIGSKWTFDASSTPKVGATAPPVRELSPIDLEQLRANMATAIEKAKADDPKELRKEIAALKKQIAAAPAKTIEKTVTVIDEREFKRRIDAAMRPVYADINSRLSLMRRAIGSVSRDAKALVGSLSGLESINLDAIAAPNGNGSSHLSASTNGTSRRESPADPRRVPSAAQPAVAAGEGRRASRAATPRANSRSSSDSSIDKGSRTILVAVASYDEGVSVEQLTVLTGYKRSSRNTYLQRLSAAGLIEKRGDTITATDAGFAELGDDYDPLPTGRALQAYWLERLGGGERELLRLLIEAGGEPLDKETLGAGAGYESSSRNTYLQRLGARKLVENAGRGQVRASATLFEER